jgi:hypothetical protein
VHNLETDAIKLGITDGSVTTPSATTADPRWGAGGTTNLASEEVTPGGNYTAGGPALANPTVTLTGGLSEFDADDPGEIAQDPSNPTDATWGIIYNDTAAGKNAIAYVDLGGQFDMTTGPLTITFGANGIVRLNQAA